MMDTAEVGRSFLKPRPWELLGRELDRDGVGLRRRNLQAGRFGVSMVSIFFEHGGDGQRNFGQRGFLMFFWGGCWFFV